MKLTFLGGAGTVTGSKYLIESGSQRLLADCGLFQGLKRLRERNWKPLSFAPGSLDAVVLTHAHLDHSGFLPRLVRTGFRGPVYCTAATRDLLEILLPDSARLQEEEAEFANRHRYSKHSPALPLYTESDALRALRMLRPVGWSTSVSVAPDMAVHFSPAGHLLGAASVLIRCASGRILFSGDLGRPDDSVMRPPAPPCETELETELAKLLNRAVQRGGVTVIPSFTVGRAQELLHLIARLKSQRLIADVPVFLNSPMAIDATQIYTNHRDEHRLTVEECKALVTTARCVNSIDESKSLNRLTEPAIIISASGMATGGRVLHHLKTFAPDERNLILFAGHQAAGTRGAALVGGADEVKIHGQWIPVHAEIAQLQSLSAHADRDQLVAWLKSAPSLPLQVFVTHGEPAAADALRQYIRRDIQIEVTVPEHGESVWLESRRAS